MIWRSIGYFICESQSAKRWRNLLTLHVQRFLLTLHMKSSRWGVNSRQARPDFAHWIAKNCTPCFLLSRTPGSIGDSHASWCVDGSLNIDSPVSGRLSLWAEVTESAARRCATSGQARRRQAAATRKACSDMVVYGNNLSWAWLFLFLVWSLEEGEQ